MSEYLRNGFKGILGINPSDGRKLFLLPPSSLRQNHFYENTLIRIVMLTIGSILEFGFSYCFPVYVQEASHENQMSHLAKS